jgi:hypothetical protein
MLKILRILESELKSQNISTIQNDTVTMELTFDPVKLRATLCFNLLMEFFYFWFN